MSDIPYMQYGVQDDYRIMFYSEHLAALTRPITLAPGYGVLKMGTALAANASAGTAGNKGKLVPYNPTTFTGQEDHPGRAYLVAEGTNATYVVNVTIADSYKFKVGDDLIINYDTTADENLGAITAIDRTTYSSYAVITFTTAIGGTAFTTARFACVFVEAGGASNNYSDCAGLLLKSVDTGTGVNAKGAIGELLLSNAVLYEGMLTNVDAAAKTGLSASSSGEFLLIK